MLKKSNTLILADLMSAPLTLGSGSPSIDSYKVHPLLQKHLFPPSIARFAKGALCLLASLSTAVAISAFSNAEAKLSSMEQMFSFGDSNIDIGNSAFITSLSTGSIFFPPPPNFNGRSSNGLLAHEYLWTLYNPSSSGLVPSYLGGTNYAVSGATTGRVNFNSISPVVPDSLKPVFGDLGVSAQLNRFLSDQPTFNPNSSLFYVSTFPNDVMYWLTTTQATGGGGLDSGSVTGLPASPIGSDQNAMFLLVENGIKNTEILITTLANQGAKHFLVPNMIDLGLTPLFRHHPNPGLSLVVSQLSSLYNGKLNQKLGELSLSIPGVEIDTFQTDALLAEVVVNPMNYGFDNVTDSCFNVMTGEVCTNPDRWLFWDYFHPTTAAQRNIGYALYNEIYITPGPAPFAAVFAAFRCSRSLRKRIRCCEKMNPSISTH